MIHETPEFDILYTNQTRLSKRRLVPIYNLIVINDGDLSTLVWEVLYNKKYLRCFRLYKENSLIYTGRDNRFVDMKANKDTCYSLISENVYGYKSKPVKIIT